MVLVLYLLDDIEFSPGRLLMFELSPIYFLYMFELTTLDLRTPNIFIILDTLLGIQSETSIKIKSKGSKPYKKAQEKEQFLREQVNKYTNQKICRSEFLKVVFFKVLPAI